MRKKVISDRMYRFLQYDPLSICYDGLVQKQRIIR